MGSAVSILLSRLKPKALACLAPACLSRAPCHTTISSPTTCPGHSPVSYTELAMTCSTGSGVGGRWSKKAASNPATFPQTRISLEQAANWARKTTDPGGHRPSCVTWVNSLTHSEPPLLSHIP